MVNSEITKVDDKHIKDLKKDLTHKGGIILYHWNSCGHCRHFMPIWDQVTSFLRNYPSYKIEYDYMSQAPRYFGHITSFPRIVAYFNGQKHEYEGSRDPDSLTQFIKNTIPSHSAVKQTKTKKPNLSSSKSSAVKQTKTKKEKKEKKPKAVKKEKK